MDSILQAMLGCSVDQTDTLISAYRDENGWHAETVIGAAGALVGHAIQSSAYSMAAQGTGAVSEFERMTNPPFGKFVNCNERLQLYIDNELACLKNVATQLDWFSADALPDMEQILAACTDHIGGQWFPRLSVPSKHMPRDWSPDAVPLFGQQMRAHLDQHKLPHNVCEVLSLTLALGHLVAESRDRLAPEIALRIGLETAIATANIGNLDRTHVLSAPDTDAKDHVDRDFDGDIESVVDEMDSAAVFAAVDEVLSTFEDESDLQLVKSKSPFNDSPPVSEDVIPLDTANASAAEGNAVSGLHESPLNDIDADDDLDSLLKPRASRLVRTRPMRTAFGKRQFG